MSGDVFSQEFVVMLTRHFVEVPCFVHADENAFPSSCVSS